jgi:transcription antitermination factor NusG
LARGPFADIAAIFAEKHDERRCRILLSMLGKQHSVLVLSNDLEKVA